jgi:predicted nuclease of predicted toxin-antitoxin system
MKVVADEGIDSQIVAELRNAGHLVSYIAELAAGFSHEKVLKLATDSESLILTADIDFGEMVYRKLKETPGIVLLRLHGLTPKEKSSLVSTAFLKHGAAMSNSFSVILPRAIRIRSLPERED